MSELKPYSNALIQLSNKIVDRDSSVWNDVLIYQDEICNCFEPFNLELVINKEEGFAYIKKKFDDDDQPSLKRKIGVGFPVSVILIILRRMLMLFDNDAADVNTADKIVTKTEIKDEIELYFHDYYNKVKMDNNIENYLKRIVEMGFLVELKQSDDDTRYKIHRILKEKITLSDIDNFKQNLEKAYGNNE